MPANKIDKILKPVERFMHNESTAGILLLFSALAAILLANSPWSAAYHHLWEYEIAIRVAHYEISNSLHHWINDGLMAMFFFVVGLELKREMIAGELSDLKKAALPLVAALGGMIFPALIYVLFNPTGAENNGWGIPMATDIAFALGIISLLGKRVPLSLKIFLTALAIADDLGAVLVIAFFYTSHISMVSLAIGVGFIALLLTANAIGIRSTLFYGILGIGGVWLAFLMSGVHATIAGVIAALAIPARTKIDEQKFVQSLEVKLREFHAIPPNDVTLLEPDQYQVIEKIYRLTKAAGTPLQRLESQLHPCVAFLIMPLFALANAGVELNTDIFSSIFNNTVSLGVLLGLFVGKFLGVVIFTWAMIKFKIAVLPNGMNWNHLFGVGFLAGVGFTMSLFITTLAFDDSQLITDAKIGIFLASIISGSMGYFVLKKASATPRPLEL
ncbi:Na+/H+ antiporter NhaA [Chryseolinea sp. H1M3-3]|uniref:Na+/H+ antiporter NhaA n=1 Tax=Chryseolinea sp. H1M3-3 TaxID=3034144 RepID=UPI0023EBA250|nr:Na+/H+ antiporter NhaA [Chryseolinea sp. H1M3-3]